MTHFEVGVRRAGRHRVGALLSEQPDVEQLRAGVAAWAMVHAVATLWLNGNLPPQLGRDPERIARAVASHLRTAHR